MPSSVRAVAILAEVERLVLAEQRAHPFEIHERERRIQEMGREVGRMDAGAVAPFSRYLADKSRPLKARLYAAVFLGMQGDPSALVPLKLCLQDNQEDESLRSTALNALGSLRLPPTTLREIPESIIEATDAGDESLYPKSVVREALSQLAGVGAKDVGAVARAAHRGGTRPDLQGIAAARHAVRAIEHSLNPKAVDALFDLLKFYKRSPPAELAVINALENRASDLAHLERAQIIFITEVVARGVRPNAARAARLLGELRASVAVQPLISALHAKDAELVAQAAQSLEDIGDPAAAEPLKKLVDGFEFDTRFARKPGKPDPRDLIERIRRAAETFQDQHDAIAEHRRN